MVANATDDTETVHRITEGVWDCLTAESSQAGISTVPRSEQALLKSLVDVHKGNDQSEAAN